MNETAGAGAPRDEEEREGRNGGRPEERAALARPRPVVALVMRGHENGDGDETIMPRFERQIFIERALAVGRG